MLPNKKSTILLILKVLMEYSDENHYLKQNDIVDLVYKNFDIEIERKTVGSALSLLEELDYDIARIPRKGVALISRTFDENEAFYIIDALFSSRSISGKDALRISKEVASCFSKYQRKNYSYIYKTDELIRTNNKQTMFNIYAIQEAIKKGKRIGFQCVDYDDNGKRIYRNNGFQYIVSPYYLINNGGRYYLLCNYREKYRPLQVFRIDYMENIEIKNDWPIKRIESLEKIKKDFTISNYINDHIYLLDGQVINAELELGNTTTIRYIKDWFGERAKIYAKDSKIYASIKCDENALYYWVLQYCDDVKVINPINLVERIKNGLKGGLKKYE